MHYLDHATRSWPKPALVYQAWDRAAGLTSSKDLILNAAQAALAELVNVSETAQWSFAGGVVEALSLALDSLPWQPGDGIVISALESQAMLASVLQLARAKGVQVYIVPYALEVPFDVAECEALLKAHPGIRLLAVTHASPVIGCVLPVAEIARLAKRYGKLCLVDASLSAGLLPLNMERDGVDFLVLSAEKALQGPSGLVALAVSQTMLNEEPVMEKRLQKRLSLASGRLSHEALLAKLAAFTEGMHWVQMMGLHNIQRHTERLLEQLQASLGEIPEVTIYGALEPPYQLPILSFNMLNHHPKCLQVRLLEEFGIWLRAGFHESRLSHESIGTIHRGGTLRVSLGYLTRPEDIESLPQALKTILVGTNGSWALL